MGTTGEITASDGVRLAYRDEGEGRPVLLLHGMFASAEANWEWTGIGPALREAGHRTIAPDARGHGGSERPHDPEAYAEGQMADDLSTLLDHLGLARCAVVGYSMGALTAARAIPVEARLAPAVLAGVGAGDILSVDRELLARAMEADDPDVLDHPRARQYRGFADLGGADLAAMAALQRGRSRQPYPWAEVQVPVLVLTGADDDLAGSTHDLAAQLPQAEARTVPGDHAEALLAPGFVPAIVDFLAEHP